MIRWVHWINWGYVVELVSKGLGVAAMLLLPWVMVYLWLIGVV